MRGINGRKKNRFRSKLTLGPIFIHSEVIVNVSYAARTFDQVGQHFPSVLLVQVSVEQALATLSWTRRRETETDKQKGQREDLSQPGALKMRISFWCISPYLPLPSIVIRITKIAEEKKLIGLSRVTLL